MSGPRVLVIEDEAQIHRFLQPALRAAGFDPERADTGEEGLRSIAARAPDAVLLDLGLPDLDGMEVLARARAFYEGPVLIISARGREAEKVEALDAGADDYVEKPFGVSELMARLRAALRRHAGFARPVQSVFRAGPVAIDLEARSVTRAGAAVQLTPKAWELLTALILARGRVATHRRLLTTVWGPAHAEDVAYLRVFIGQLRERLEEDAARPCLILTEPGVGYRLVIDEER